MVKDNNMEQHLTKEQALQFFSDFYGGEHHIPGFSEGVKPFGYGWVVKHDRGDLSTFDGNGLTRLVIMAHDQCIRVGISPHNSGKVKIHIFKRQGREGSFSERHPDLETAVNNFRERSKN